MIYLIYLVFFLLSFIMINVDFDILNVSIDMGLFGHFLVNVLVMTPAFLVLLVDRRTLRLRNFLTKFFSPDDSLIFIFCSTMIYIFFAVVFSYRVTEYGQWYSGIKPYADFVDKKNELSEGRKLSKLDLALTLATKSSVAKEYSQNAKIGFEDIVK